MARGATAAEVFAAVSDAVGRLFGVDRASLSRYDPDATVTILADWSTSGDPIPVGTRLALGGHNVPTLVLLTGDPARIDSHANDPGPIGLLAREHRVRSSVGTPIIVDGRLWGVIAAGSTRRRPLPPDAVAGLADFTNVLAAAIANTDRLAELAASRARIVLAAEETLRRIERALHDRAQQRLVSLALALRAAQATLPPELGELDDELSRVAHGLASVQDQLREIARGIQPAIPTQGGLRPAQKTLARRSPIPVELDVRRQPRLPERVEVATGLD
jgi:GAF domain-containing protein